MKINAGSTAQKQFHVNRLLHLQLLPLLLAAVIIHAEQVSKFAYKGHFAALNNSKLVLQDKVVAMGEYVYVSSSIDSLGQKDPCSIMFIIDVSQTNGETDPNAIRFSVVRQVLDTIYKKAPETKVGLALFGNHLWFYKPDDPLFTSLSGTNDCYIHPLGLDSMYSGVYSQASSNMGGVKSRTPYQKKGIDVLKMYLETRENWSTVWPGLIPKYWPTQTISGVNNDPYWGQMTNINIAFDGGKDALSKCPHPKHRQFIIFFSDGKATWPQVNTTEYVSGTNVPTTFTIFYNADQTDLQLLQQMNNNIKNNNYSVSNAKFTNIWQLSMNQNALIKILVHDILLKIIQTSNSWPTKIVVNTSGNSNWDSTGFLYKRMFPLIGTTTDFTLKIDYKIKKDSITQNGQVIPLGVKDTQINVLFTAQIQNGAPVPPNVTLTWWGRNLGFFYNNDTVHQVTDNMKNLEVRFSEYKVDTIYGYDSALVTLATSAAPADAETLRLAKNGAYFTALFPRVIGNPAQWNKTLEHQKKDSIIAVFRNPYLPLDTLRIAVPFYDGYGYQVNKAIYFDNNADGHVDSVYVGMAGDKLSENGQLLTDKIPLPAHRQLQVNSSKVLAAGFGYSVTEKMADIQTYVTDKDVIEIKDTIKITADIAIVPCNVMIEDSMAPVIMKASFVDSVKQGSRDELTVILSEPVTSITGTNPFVYLYTAQQQAYDGSLNLIGQNGATGLFSVLSVTSTAKTIKDGDSIRINWNIPNKVSDNVGNAQDNPNNIRRPIAVSVVEEGLKMEKAVYFDKNADGHVDSIYLQIYGDKVKDHVADVVKVLKLPAYRNLAINQSLYTTGGIGLRVTEQSSEIRTYVTDQDIAVIENKVVLPDSVIILPASVKIQDAMAPVIMTADVIDSMIYVIKDDATDSLTTLGTDELFVVFSEPVDKILPSAPFNLYATQKNNKEYEIEVSVKSQAGNTVQFIIKSVTGENSVMNGDSIRIYASSQKNVSDTLGNNQSNPGNVKRVVNVQIIVKKILIALPFDLIMKATLFEPGREYDLSTIAGVPEIQEMLKTVARRGSGKYKDIMIITIEPDNSKNLFKENEYLTGELAGMYDALGNVILSGGKQMYYYKPWKKLIYIWDGRNTGGRMVGSSTYIVFAKAERKARGNLTYLGKFQTEWALKKPVGVVEK